MIWWMIVPLLIFAAVIAGVEYFFRFAIVRKKPSGKKSLSASKGLISLEPYADKMQAGEAWIRAQNPETVYIQSHDGLKLAGHFIDARSDRTLILFHGYRSRAYRDFSCVAEYYRSLGFNLLLVDQRAHGDSEGRHICFGAVEKHDCVRWAEYVDGRIGGEIFLDGISMGASTVLMAAGEKLPGSVKGVIADCGFTSPGAIMLKVMEKDLGIRCRPLFNLISRVIRLRAGFDVYGSSTVEAVKNCSVPILFLHGTDDKFVPCDMTKEAYAACTSEKELVLVEGAGHGACYLMEEARCQEALRRFLERCSRKA